jgi:hypothetical protein
MATEFVGPRCGFVLLFRTEPPRFGCDECSATIEVHPSAPQTTVAVAAPSEIEAGAEELKQRRQ